MGSKESYGLFACLALKSFNKCFLRINSESGTGDKSMSKKCPVRLPGTLTPGEDRQGAVARLAQRAPGAPIVTRRMVT